MGEDPSRLPVGTVIGAYRVEARLGQGSFGAVYRASTSAGTLVALKVLLSRPDDDDRSVLRFRREAELASRLRHPNSVRVLDQGEASGLRFIAFELLRGEPLDAAIARGRIPPPRAVEIAIEILSALEEAHGLGLVHRDLKPANIFLAVDPSGVQRVKVVDFGIAKSLNPGTQAGLTRDGRVIGTPLYMSPEHMAGEAVGPASDLFAVGLILAEMIHGGSLYPEMPAMALLVQRAAGRPVPLPPELGSTPLRAIVERATRLDPAARWASASDMKSALAMVSSATPDMVRVAAAATQHVSLEPPAGTPVGSALPGSRSRPARSRIIAAIAAAGVAAAGISVALFLLPRGPDEPVATRPSASAPAPSMVLLSAPPSSVDYLVDVAPMLATLRKRFGSARIYGLRVNRESAFVTVEEPGTQTASEELYVVEGDTARLHGKSLSRRQLRPIDLTDPLLARVPALVKDAEARVTTTDRVDYVVFTCPSCVNQGSGACVVFAAPSGISMRTVCYDWSGRFSYAN